MPGAPVVQQEMGTLEVADRVFQDIVRRIASETSGIAKLNRAPARLFRRGSTEGVSVERGEGEVAFSIRVTVSYEASIPKMVAELRERLVQTAEEATGYKVRSVNVVIDRILPPKPEGKEAAGSDSGAVPDLPPIPDQE